MWAANTSLANPFGTHTLTSSPDFVLTSSNPLLADFHLQSTSGAINTGTLNNAPTTDKDGNVRPSSSAIDIGCYEYQTQLSINEINNGENLFILFPNPAKSSITLQLNEAYKEIVQVEIYNLLGQKVNELMPNSMSSSIIIDVTNLKTGTYLLVLKQSEITIGKSKFLKF